jgi:hypothetical protein
VTAWRILSRTSDNEERPKLLVAGSPYGGQELGLVLRRCGFIEDPPQLLLFTLGQGSRSGSLGLEQGAEKYPIVDFGAGLTEITMIDATPHVLCLEDLSLPLSAPLAQHTRKYT